MRVPRGGGKTVLVLGAGFSFPAGGPVQSSLLADIVGERCKEVDFVGQRDRLVGILTNELGIPPGDCPKLSLEDLFTPIDRCLAEGSPYRNIKSGRLRELREELEFLISKTIDVGFRIAAPGANAYVRNFARALVRVASRRADLAREADASAAKSYDPFSLISLNWDILLDRALFAALQEVNSPGAGYYDPIGVVDYCCNISSFEEDDRRIRPGLWALGARGFNVKLLKLHGSMNWLQCPNCQRMFVSFDEKLFIANFLQTGKCRHCAKAGLDVDLRGSLVMPTFLKDLSNFQVKLVWQNAGLELLEAERLVFVGYSLPQADFEFRQLLSRKLNPRASVKAILRRNPDRPAGFDAEAQRYREFFLGREVDVCGAGVEEFVEDFASETASWGASA